MTWKQLVGVVLLGAALWIGVELHTEGFDGAFGGALASSKPVTRTQRAAGAFQRAWDSSDVRTERALEQPDS